MEELKKKLEDILDVETVNDEDALEEFDYWDSLAILSIISMASESYKKTFKAADIRECKTIGNLCKLILN
jgi:acyl carrier protein